MIGIHNKRWEHFHHESDVGVRGRGTCLAEAFEQAALAMTGVIVDQITIRPSQEIRVSCQAPDQELLLTEWLNALIYEMSLRRMLFSRFDVTLEGLFLEGSAWGEPVDVSRHRPAVEIKGATFTELKVKLVSDGQWIAQCVVDV